ncbi:DegV domain-containing protein [Cellulomonas soli]|uniref:DegV domain-containing protein n=1 Tax=Cellulomonas soli TaxID=931535 RepID=A0A512PDD6_9CELL|nr:DegV domain-containing protein [Cellulomonas soli]
MPPGAAEDAGVLLVPLDVVIDGERFVEGVDLDRVALLEGLARGARVSTSQPPPAAFADAYARAAAQGAREIVSVHLSGDLSGTVRAAQLAAAAAPVPVHVVDSRTVGMALGFAVLAAARLARGETETTADADHRRWWEAPWARGQVALPDGLAVATAARAVGAGSSAWFLVDSLDHLRRGGRLSAPAAALGAVLGLRPILGLRDGRVGVAEKVRTRRAARERLEALAVSDVLGRASARVAVHHLGQPELAAQVAERLTSELGPRVREVVVCEAGAVLAAHVGPGLLAVLVTDA